MGTHAAEAGQFQGKTVVVRVACPDLLPKWLATGLRRCSGLSGAGGVSSPTPLLHSLTGCIHASHRSHIFTSHQPLRIAATGEALPLCLGLREIRNSHHP